MNTGQQIRTWAQGRRGRFLPAQLVRTAIVVAVLTTFLLGAARVRAQSPDDGEHPCGVPEWVIKWEQQQAAAQAGQTAIDYSYPSAIDWRNHGGHNWTTSIKSQGSCGSCSAFAVVGAIESCYEVAHNNPGANPNLSEAHLYFCNGGDCEHGIWPGAALDTAEDDGVVDEACFPYTDHNQSCSLCANWQNRVTKINCWYGATSVSEMKYLIATYGPIATTMAVYQDFHSYPGGVYRHTWGAFSGYHAVVLVGYNDSGGYWIGKNSWGTSWGESGWFRIAYGEVGIDDYAYVPRFDRIAPSKASNVRANGWTGPYTSDTTPSFEWNGATDDNDGCGLGGYYVAVDDWTPEGGSGNDWWAGDVTAFTVPDALPDGEHIFAVTAKDKSGNINPTNTNQQGDAPYYTFHVDTTAPTNPTSAASGCSAQDGIWQRACTDPDFTWSGANDHGGSGVQDYHVYWGQNPNGQPAVWRSSASYNPPAFSPGNQIITYYLRISTRDNLGHESAPKTVFTLRYDGSQPTGNPVINGGVETVHSVNVLVEPHGQDTGSGLARAHLSNDGANWQTQDYASMLPWSLLPHNRTWNTIQIELEDGAGNRSGRYSRRVCLDLYPAHPASANYRLWGAGPTAAGGRLISTSYRLDQTVGQNSAGELLTSVSYRLRSGFQALWPATPGEEMFTVFHCGSTIYLPLVLRNR